MSNRQIKAQFKYFQVEYHVQTAHDSQDLNMQFQLHVFENGFLHNSIKLLGNKIIVTKHDAMPEVINASLNCIYMALFFLYNIKNNLMFEHIPLILFFSVYE